MEIFWTVFSGVLVFSIGQIFLKLVLEPVQELHKIRGEIADTLIFYANVSIRYTGIPQDQLDKASTTYRERASQLLARAHLVRGYDRWAVILKIPKRQAIVTASKALIGLSNNVFDTGLEATRIKEEYRREVCHSLNLKIGT